MHRQAEFGAFLCLTVPKTAVESPETGPTGRVSGKKLPVGREREGEREKERKRERGREEGRDRGRKKEEGGKKEKRKEGERKEEGGRKGEAEGEAVL